MKKITVSISALFLALGVLSGCGEKKEEAPKAEAPAATEAKPAEQAAAPVQEAAPAAAPAEQAAAPAQEAAPAANPMSAMADAANSAANAMGDAAKAAGDAAQAAGDSAAQAAGDAAQAAGDAAAQAADATQQAAGDAAQAAADTAQQATGSVDGGAVFNKTCIACHGSSAPDALGAPKLGDKAAWAPRIAQGADALYAAAINGKMTTPGKVMPPKGGNTALSDDEVKAAVDHMLSSVQ